MTEPPPLYTANDLAERFQLHPETVREHIRKGEWPHIKFGPRSVRFTEEHIQQILTSHDKQPQAPRPSRRRRQIDLGDPPCTSTKSTRRT